MKIGILKELQDDRVALVPEIVKKLEEAKIELCVEAGAGEASHYHDFEYKQANARLEPREIVYQDSDLLVTLQPIPESELKEIKTGGVLVSLYEPFVNPDVCQTLAQFPITVFSMDMIPRITLAQSMDVLSSMASIAGYKAVIEGARLLPRYFPMITSAAGTVPPAKVLILGAGVAGLQAVATARRLGSVVEVFDTRLAVQEQVESLGAKFVEVEGAVDDVAAGGYAVEQTEEYKKRQSDKIHERVVQSDVVITTALLRGSPAPLLINKDMVNEMRPGSVIVDLAASTGGNCELTENAKTTVHYDVTIVGNSNLAAEMPYHASQLWSKNLYNFLNVLIPDNELNLDWDNEIIRSSCLVHNREVYYGKEYGSTNSQ